MKLIPYPIPRTVLSISIGAFLAGVVFAVVIMQYPGSIEIQLSRNEIVFKVDGHSLCQ